MRESPCHCKEPGPGHTLLRAATIRVTRAQFNERRAKGLPLQFDIEKSLDQDWV
jgi:hypothetical protein